MHQCKAIQLLKALPFLAVLCLASATWASAPGSIAHARAFSDDTSVSLLGKVIMADRTDLCGNRLYIEEPSRSAGILVIYTGEQQAVRGATVDVTGTINTLASGERWIDAGSNGIKVITPGEHIPIALGLNNRACGGSDFNVLTPGANSPVTPSLYNVGLLVKTWGRVTGVFPGKKCFYIDDGSGLNDTTGHAPGIKVAWDWQAISPENPEIVPPSQGQYVWVEGISGIESPDETKIIRVLRPIKQSDFPLFPVIAVSPSIFDRVCIPGASVEETLTIANTGPAIGQQLSFNITTTGASGGGAYAWQDSTQADGPSFNWIDISSTGTQITGLAGDGCSGALPIGFSFPYYGSNYTQLYVAENGLIGFGPTDDYNCMGIGYIPDVWSPNNAIYWFCTDLYERPDSRAYYENRPEGLIIEYANYGISYTDSARITAELILKPSGEILIQYQSMTPDWPLDYGAIGIENADGTRGIQIACFEPYIQPGLAVRILQQDWLRMNPLSGSVQGGQNTPLAVTLDAGSLEVGDYSASVQIHSNDPLTPVASIPVVFHVRNQVLAPTFNPDTGVFSSAPAVTIDCATAEAQIHYTIDGSEPSINSPVYTDPVPVSDGITLKARAFMTGWSDSAEKSAIYTVTPYNNAVVTAVFPDFFYIETQERSRGIRVNKTAHGLAIGAKVNVSGVEGTNADGERYIEADSVARIGDGKVNPIAINNYAIGGGSSGYQAGIVDSFGWNNTGMLIKVWGNVTYIDPAGGFFYVDDGSAVYDNSALPGIRVLTSIGCDLRSLAEGTHVIVTGISSCFIDDKVRRLIRIRTQNDISVVSDPGESFTFTLYQHSNSFSLPLPPLNPDPASVFGDTSLIKDNLRTFNSASGTYATYDQSFGYMLLGNAYWLNISSGGSRTFTYNGFPDGLRVNGIMTDMCISLPGVTGQQGGTHYIGHPFNHNVEWVKCLVTDGVRTIPVWDNNPATDDAVQSGWLDMYWKYQDNQADAVRRVDPSGVQGSQNLEPGCKYEIITHRPNLALIVPMVDSTPPDPPVVTDDGEYINSISQLHATWTASDAESDIEEYQYAVGSTPSPPSDPADFIVAWASSGQEATATPGGLSLKEHGAYYFYVKAKNGNELWSDIGSSDGITIDTVAPIPGTASVETSANISPITVTYTGASDDFSGIDKVELWYKQGSAGTWADSGSFDTGTSGSINFLATENDTYYFALRAQDRAGNWSALPTGDGDCQTAYSGAVSTSGRSFIRNDYLYDGGPSTQTSVYDASGSQVRQATRSYGSEGELLSKSGSAEPVSVTYDSLYRTKTITDGNRNTTSYTYDKVDGSLTEIRYPGDDAVRFETHYPTNQDPALDDSALYIKRTTGKYVGIQFQGDTETWFIYNDPGNLLSHIKYPANPTKDIYFIYDNYARLDRTWDGLETSPTTGKKVYSYDNLDIIKDVTTTYAGLPARIVSYGYYDDGSLSGMSVPTPSGTGVFSCSYDVYGRLTNLTNPYGEMFSWTYKLNDWLESQTLRNNSRQIVAQTTYDYNAHGFMTSLLNQSGSGAILSQFGGSTQQTRMSYDATGNLLSMLADVPGMPAHSGLTNYTYDTTNPLAARDRLTQELSARGGGYTSAFGYDPTGNATTFRGVSQSFNSNNQKDAAGFVYDNRGNPTTYNGANLAFDTENRMTAYGSVLTAGYTGDGLRAYTTSAAGTRYFLYDGATPVCEMDASGNVVAVNTFGANGLLSRNDGTASVFYTFDPQGNVTQVLNSDGTAASNLLYDSYGNGLSAVSTSPYGFGGQHGYYTDPETGLVLATNRYYDPAEGRWLTRDPIGYAGGMNLYAYVSGNPANLIDPWGLEDLPVNVHCGHDVAVLGAAGAEMANQEILNNQQPGLWGIIKSGTLTTLNDIGAGLLGVLDFGTGTASFVEKPSWETAGGLCQDIATAAGAVSGGLSLGAGLTKSSLSAATSELIEGSGGTGKVYGLANRATGEMEYLGQTTNEIAREAYWAKKLPHLKFNLLADNLTPVEADGIEQVFMEGCGGASGYSNGGTLLNRINSISPKNPYYSTATNAAYKILFR